MYISSTKKKFIKNPNVYRKTRKHLKLSFEPVTVCLSFSRVTLWNMDPIKHEPSKKKLFLSYINIFVQLIFLCDHSTGSPVKIFDLLHV